MSIVKFKPETKFWMLRGKHSGEIKFACRTVYYLHSNQGTYRNRVITYQPDRDIIQKAGSSDKPYRYLSEESISLKEMIALHPNIEKFIDR